MHTEMSKTIISIVINLKTRKLLAQNRFCCWIWGIFGAGILIRIELANLNITNICNTEHVSNLLIH